MQSQNPEQQQLDLNRLDDVERALYDALHGKAEGNSTGHVVEFRCLACGGELPPKVSNEGKIVQVRCGRCDPGPNVRKHRETPPAHERACLELGFAGDAESEVV